MMYCCFTIKGIPLPKAKKFFKVQGGVSGLNSPITRQWYQDHVCIVALPYKQASAVLNFFFAWEPKQIFTFH